MGKFPDLETKEMRSSGKSFRPSRLHPKFRLCVSICVSMFAVAVLFFVMSQGTAMKKVTLIVDGVPTIAITDSKDVSELLTELAIPYTKNDHIQPAASDEIMGGETILVRHAIPVAITVDGRELVKYTTEYTLNEALEDWRIELGEEDRMEPGPHSYIEPNMSVSIVRVQTVFEDHEQVLPYEVVHQTDATLLKGKQAVVSEGREGLLVTTVKKVLEDGVVVSEEVVDENMAEPVVNQVVAVGSRNPVVILSASSPDVHEVTKKGVTFGVKKVLENVTLTAYDAGINSTGKSEGHPAYGKTYTGTTVKEGRTIAVDPKVIPLGWWVYIDGYGFRKAEDIGSAIKGNKIDIYVESEAEANKFGLKRGNTVYVIGPKMPES